MGAGNARAQLEQAAGGLSRLEFREPAGASEYANVLQAADALLLNERPGVAEMSLPSKLTSYLSASRPVIAATGAASGSARLLTASGGGVRVDPGEPDLLVEAAAEVRADPARALELGRAGKAYADSHFRQKVALEAYDAWVDRLLALAA